MKNKYNSFERFSSELSPELLCNSEEKDFLSNQNFEIKTTNRLKSFIFNIKSSILQSLLLSKAYFSGDVDRKKIPLGVSFSDIKATAKEDNTIDHFIQTYNSTLFEGLRVKINNSFITTILNVIDKTVLFSLTIPAIIIVLICLPLQFLYQTSKIVRISFKNSMLRNTEGFFSSAGNSNAVFVHKRNSQSDLFESVVSHEHIHFIQHKFITHEKSHYFIFLTENWELFFDFPRPKDISRIKYLFESIEIEARIHELVVCYFGKFKILPRNHLEFIDFLNEFRFYLLIFSGNKTEKSEIKKLLVSRFTAGVEESFFYIDKLLTGENKNIFFIEVLPVFYSNLLIYYGFSSLSAEFLKTVPNSGLFEKMYRADEFLGE